MVESNTINENDSLTFETNWFATQVDRCFETGSYGMGIRLYTTDNYYVVISGISYDTEHNILTVEDNDNNVYEIRSEPDIQLFKDTILKKWEKWDLEKGEKMDEDRYDYKPWALASLKSLALELGVYKNTSDEKFQRYVN